MKRQTQFRKLMQIQLQMRKSQMKSQARRNKVTQNLIKILQMSSALKRSKKPLKILKMTIKRRLLHKQKMSFPSLQTQLNQPQLMIMILKIVTTMTSKIMVWTHHLKMSKIHSMKLNLSKTMKKMDIQMKQR